MEFLKSTAGKIASGLVALAVIAGGISWWRMDEPTRNLLLSGTGKLVAWSGVVLLLPWATFFVIGRVEKMGSNLAGAALIAAYTLLELLLLLWLFDWSIHSTTGGMFVAFGTLVAAVYNLLTCDWIAEKVA
jgi:hypothetical protein